VNLITDNIFAKNSELRILSSEDLSKNKEAKIFSSLKMKKELMLQKASSTMKTKHKENMERLNNLEKQICELLIENNKLKS